MYAIRRHKRIALPATASLTVKGGPRVQSLQTMVADISLSGIGVYSDHAITVGKEIAMDIYFVSSDGSLKSTSVEGNSHYVRRIRDIYYVGIHFKEDLAPEKQPLLYECLMVLLKCQCN